MTFNTLLSQWVDKRTIIFRGI